MTLPYTISDWSILAFLNSATIRSRYISYAYSCRPPSSLMVRILIFVSLIEEYAKLYKRDPDLPAHFQHCNRCYHLDNNLSWFEILHTEGDGVPGWVRAIRLPLFCIDSSEDWIRFTRRLFVSVKRHPDKTIVRMFADCQEDAEKGIFKPSSRNSAGSHSWKWIWM